MTALRVADLLGAADMGASRILAGRNGIQRAVTDVRIADPLRSPTEGRGAGSLVVLAGPPAGIRWEHLLDLALRQIQAEGGAGLVVPPDLEPALATVRLADRLEVPLIARPAGVDHLDLALLLRSIVRDAQAERYATLLPLLPDPDGRLRSVQELTTALAQVTGSTVAVVSADGGVVGDARAARAVEDGPDERAVVVAIPGQDGAPGAWVALKHPSGGVVWADLARTAVRTVAGELIAWLAEERLELERERRSRTTVLNELLEQGDGLSPDVTRRAGALGWPLVGWHTAIHVRHEGGGRGSAAAVGAALERLVAGWRRDGLPAAAPVERSDGWVTWFTTETPPSPARVRSAVRAARETLTRRDGTRVALGVGSARRDAGGIALSITEARQGALIAAGDEDPLAVRVVQDLGASRLLLGWYGSGAFTDLARQLLGPLAEPDEAELLETLEAYLERSCSAARTARALGLHRNTVGQRMARVEKVLGVSLGQADTRLALQLALRARRRSG